MLTDLLEWLQSLPQAGVVIGAGLLVFGECTIGLGFIAPGETALFIAGTTANSVPRFLIMWLVTSLCATAGYSVGYAIGKYFGPKLRQTKLVRKHGAQGWDKATDFLRRRGALAVVFAIFLPVLRTLVPAAAGASGLAFRKFLPAVLVGTTVWSALHIGIGSAAGEAAKWIEDAIGRVSWILLGAVAVAALIWYLVKRKRAKRESGSAADESTVNQDR
ncbi:membrane protein DedA with SNARE-associated domain [Tamaricihabitans halophyticus]|uniref:Membrane protein DedA with SNARE-associated domain n=2 Tax=Tamaricihabitans halophyticus TaxID=1262583 RepID=A0A4R2QXX5_9PSEU|nr:membrane protein DedA with SNARE-associated domain [Tamaricihabitans halophyticus]